MREKNNLVAISSITHHSVQVNKVMNSCERRSFKSHSHQPQAPDCGKSLMLFVGKSHLFHGEMSPLKDQGAPLSETFCLIKTYQPEKTQLMPPPKLTSSFTHSRYIQDKLLVSVNQPIEAVWAAISCCIQTHLLQIST